MTKRCSGCGADLAIVGRVHRCIPRSRDADDTVLAGTTRDAKPAGEVVTPGRQSNTKGRAGAKRLGTRGPAPGHGGRPRKGHEHKTITAQRPWEKAGISRRTWYRQQQRGKK